ncbi:MAG: hypothetical protein OFPI_21750 [Osedax symbiont Rs2]|nr:MAG: hypothetical protein OFPI_21750 [Osedax symbiont Rs2]
MKRHLQKNSINLVVVRHGESEANKKGIISDKNVDHPLTAKGIFQAEKTAERLKNEKFDLIISSTRTRARRTAKIINQYHGLDIIERDDLIERDFGVIGGVAETKVLLMMQQQGFGWVDVPESEALADIDHRVAKVMDFLKSKHADKKILIATHADIVKSFHRVINGVSDEESILIKIENSEPHYFSA